MKKHLEDNKDNAFKEENETIGNMIDIEALREKYGKPRTQNTITIYPEETRTSISIRMKGSYHKMFARYAHISGMTIGEFYEKMGIFYMKHHPHQYMNTGDILDEL